MDTKIGPLVLLTVAVTVVAVAAVVSLFLLRSNSCDPEVRDAALSRDVHLMLSGAISYSESVERESERIARCGD